MSNKRAFQNEHYHAFQSDTLSAFLRAQPIFAKIFLLEKGRWTKTAPRFPMYIAARCAVGTIQSCSM